MNPREIYRRNLPHTHLIGSAFRKICNLDDISPKDVVNRLLEVEKERSLAVRKVSKV